MYNRHHRSPKVDAATLLSLLAVMAAFYVFWEEVGKRTYTTLDDIMERGEITLITRNDSHSYFLYDRTPMGLEYELAKAFADSLGVKLGVRVYPGWEEMRTALERGEGDFIGAGTVITPQREGDIRFSDPYMAVRQHIVVHRTNRTVKKPADLAGKTVHVEKNSPGHAALLELARIGLTVTIRAEEVAGEELIRRVAQKEIEVAVTDSNLALIARRYYLRTVSAAPLSGEALMAWGVHRDARKLSFRINTFFRTLKENGEFERICDRYYRDFNTFDYVDLMMFHRKVDTLLPKYEKTIKKAAARHGFDWRLIAAQIYQESHFDPLARSHADAHGLMQLLPATAKSVGVENVFDPKQNIAGGVKYLGKLYNFFDKAEGEDRLLISLATYNVGHGHVFDARQLARKQGLDPNKWASIRATLPLLSKKEYYKNAKYGYCRGGEPLRYIRRISLYYDILRYRAVWADAGKATPSDT